MKALIGEKKERQKERMRVFRVEPSSAVKTKGKQRNLSAKCVTGPNSKKAAVEILRNL